jgi:hypothetical protein
MRDDFRNLLRLDPTIEREIEIERYLDGLAASDQRGESHDAPVAHVQAWPLPHIPEQAFLRISIKRGATR